MGLDPAGNTPEEFGSFIKAEITRCHAVVKSRHSTLADIRVSMPAIAE